LKRDDLLHSFLESQKKAQTGRGRGKAGREDIREEIGHLLTAGRKVVVTTEKEKSRPMRKQHRGSMPPWDLEVKVLLRGGS